MAGIEVSPELLERVKSTLDNGASGLGDVAALEPAGVNAGESTSSVVETIGLLLQASAGIAAGVEKTSNDLRSTRETYLRDDDAAAALFHPVR